jgi:hypothetical protein
MTECPEDRDMLDMANEELSQAMEEEKRLQNLLLKSLLPRDDADERDCILEVRAGNNTSIDSIRSDISLTPIVLVSEPLSSFSAFLHLFYLYSLESDKF